MKNKTRNIIWTIVGTLMMIVLVYATTTITDNGISTPSMTNAVTNFSTMDSSIKMYASNHSLMGNNNGESLELWNMKPTSKAYIGWYGYDDIAGPGQAIGWFGCHYNSTAVGEKHSHCSIETLGADGMNSKFTVTYGSADTKASVDVFGADFGVANLAVFNRTGKTKFTPNTTLEIYPNTQSTYGLQITNSSGAIDLSVLGSNYLIINDHVEIPGSRLLILKSNTTVYNCNATYEGSIYYDGTTKKHLGCNSTTWNALY